MRHGRGRFVAGFLAAPLAVYLIFMIWPYVQTLMYSFTSWGGFSNEAPFAGLDNYRQLLSDDTFQAALLHNVFFLVALPLVTILLALFFAFLLNVGGRGNRAGVRGVFGSSVYKVIFFFPQVLSVAIIVILWDALYRTDGQGLINFLLIKLHLVDPNHPLQFVNDPTPFLGVPKVLWWILIVVVWANVGFYLVLFSAAMQSISKDIYEAAMLDGATRVHTFFRITLPLLRDSVSVAWVYIGFVALDMFVWIFALTPQQGGPNHASEVFATVLWREAFTRGQFGYACAMGVAMAIFTLILGAIQLTATRRERIEL
ncbi:carbohydrate ABC transporter permease [Rhizomonospora bruguierae]|uniref:carbohydrate ABC transporter permease n=1 Tax=Rhizomonospora bruguierae TaxID=1581705 RepID=UPI001BCACF02|nr:sugar ABC transporter permease [Micromonospora sp. NBRC 107566]